MWNDDFSTHASGNVNGDHEGLVRWMKDHQRDCNKAKYVLLWESHDYEEDKWDYYKEEK